MPNFVALRRCRRCFRRRYGLRKGGGGAWLPAFEMYERDDTLNVVVELAGIRGEDVDIAIEGDMLSLEGDRPDPERCEGRSYHVANIGYGPFALDVRLPFNVDADAASANYDNGFLHIVLPRIRGRSIVATQVPGANAPESE